MIAHYNDDTPAPGPSNLAMVLIRRARMQGFIVFDHWTHYPRFLEEVGPLVSAGRIDYEETIVEGLEKTPDAFLDLFQGANQARCWYASRAPFADTMTTSPTVVFGGTGFLGATLVRELVESGRPTRLVARRPARPSWAEDGDPLEVFEADIRDARRVAEVLEGAGAVVNATSLYVPSRHLDFADIHVTAAAKLARLAREPASNGWCNSRASAPPSTRPRPMCGSGRAAKRQCWTPCPRPSSCGQASCSGAMTPFCPTWRGSRAPRDSAVRQGAKPATAGACRGCGTRHRQAHRH